MKSDIKIIKDGYKAYAFLFKMRRLIIDEENCFTNNGNNNFI